MKKFLFILLFSLVILSGCSNNKNNKEDYFTKVEQIDTTNIIEIEGFVTQTLHNEECLALIDPFEICYYVSSTLVYDRMNVNDSVYFGGTYTYLGNDSLYHTVPVYISKNIKPSDLDL